MKTAKFKITGIVPLLLHNPEILADPTHPAGKEFKSVSKKRNKSDEDHEYLALKEFEFSLYVNQEGQLILKEDMILACLIDGAKKDKNGSKFKPAVFVDGPMILKNGRAYTKDKVMANVEKYRHTAFVKVSNSKILRTRPMLHDWNGEIEIMYDPTMVDSLEIKRALEQAGRSCGLGDYRPRFGRFEVEEI